MFLERRYNRRLLFCSECFEEIGRKSFTATKYKSKKTKTKNNKTDFYLPIGDKEKRCDRYEVNPVYEYDDMIIYSPVAIHFLRDYWENSCLNFVCHMR